MNNDNNHPRKTSNPYIIKIDMQAQTREEIDNKINKK